MREFGFELALCAHLEDPETLVARQLGGGVAAPGNRILDVVTVTPGPEFDARTEITPARIPALAVESDVGPGRFQYWKDAFDCHPDRARDVVDRAVDVGFFERERRGNRDYVRQVARYPDWFGRIRAIENKPDLGSPGALRRQLRTDVSLALADEVVLATESHVTRAHLNRIPDEVGVWRFDPPDGVEVVQPPTPLPVAAGGIELVEEHPGRAEIRPVTAAEKAQYRRRLAERAYGKGWRPDEFPACRRATVERGGVPRCDWHGRVVDPGNECGPDCPGYAPDDGPTVDAAAERADRSPWVDDPDGVARRQAGLDWFSYSGH
ncbi:DUF5787 family protein [Halostella sp. PRR32]|uniref:DUF5787 family protein n=1 Tax=Halostella sp. PRR32 TaxID=3098147 RepID=UPI002B1DBB7A|nr:DUF5787 family protein [Halostella sp. PRR32]